MGRDQIYSSQPTDEVFKKLIEAFGLSEVTIDQSFTRIELKNRDVLNKVINLVPYLKTHYLPCKARTYLNDLNYKNIITILRHALKTRGFTVVSKERYSKGIKYIHYRITNYKSLKIKKEKKNENKNEDKNEKLIITFN